MWHGPSACLTDIADHTAAFSLSLAIYLSLRLFFIPQVLTWHLWPFLPHEGHTRRNNLGNLEPRHPIGYFVKIMLQSHERKFNHGPQIAEQYEICTNTCVVLFE